jgi:hypothetical protein
MNLIMTMPRRTVLTRHPTPTGQEYDLIDKIVSDLLNVIDDESKKQVEEYITCRNVIKKYLRRINLLSAQRNPLVRDSTTLSVLSIIVKSPFTTPGD